MPRVKTHDCNIANQVRSKWMLVEELLTKIINTFKKESFFLLIRAIALALHTNSSIMYR